MVVTGDLVIITESWSHPCNNTADNGNVHNQEREYFNSRLYDNVKWNFNFGRQATIPLESFPLQEKKRG